MTLMVIEFVRPIMTRIEGGRRRFGTILNASMAYEFALFYTKTFVEDGQPGSAQDPHGWAKPDDETRAFGRC